MIRVTLAILSLILASACIDGPVGYESNNWLGLIGFGITGIALLLWTILDGTMAKINN
jgi:hypothetical protein